MSITTLIAAAREHAELRDRKNLQVQEYGSGYILTFPDSGYQNSTELVMHTTVSNRRLMFQEAPNG